MNPSIHEKTGRRRENAAIHPGRRKSLAAMLGLATGLLSPDIAIRGVDAATGSNICAGKSCRLALVLGGGCHRALAHVGVIKVLEANGITPDLVVGTSAGSMVGALYASGLRAAGLEKAAAELTWDAIQKFDLSRFGFYTADPLRAYINRTVKGKKIEEFPVRYAAVAADLQTGTPRMFIRGEAGLAVQASASTPGVFQPTMVDGRQLVDGGVISPVPVMTAKNLGANTVIAVNVSFPPSETRLRDVVDVVMQAFTISTHQLVMRELATADVAVVPAIPQVDDMGFENHPLFIAAGERAASAALPAIRKALSRNKTGTRQGERA
ncbi:MAG: patatin-like phospholipase family protein [Burkholderiales bacterium]